MSLWQKEVIPMSQASELYWKAQSLDVPMTRLVDRIVAEGLGGIERHARIRIIAAMNS
jgi:hypothetical protein